MYENYLVHHGIKGMKWGVRRARKLTEAQIAKRKKIAKRVAIGAAVGATAVGTAYAVKRAKANAVSDNEIKELYRKGNLASVRKDSGADWATFNSKRGQYTRKQLANIVRADRSSNSAKFHKAVNAKLKPNRGTSTYTPKRINFDINIDDEAVRAAAAIALPVVATILKKYSKGGTS